VDPKRFFAELQRRNVYRVLVAYGVVSWLLIQVATQVFPFFEIPNWVVRMVVILLLFGCPLALVLAWAYEITPQGLKRTKEVDPGKSIRGSTGRVLNFVIIGVLLLVIGVLVFQRLRPHPASSAEVPAKSIAVLPFVDLSQQKDQEYFSDGISEQIISALARIHGLFVVARTSAFAFKGKTEDIREMGRLLHVRHVLEGSVSRGPGRVRVDARLIDVTNGYQLWAEMYDSSEQDFLLLQNDLAQKVASALQIELQLAETSQLGKAPTNNTEAYDLYLRGRYFLNKRTMDSIQKGRALFEQAVAKDPRFAQGHAGIADSYIGLAKIGAITPAEAEARAWLEVSSALEIDGNLVEGLVSRGILLTDFEWNWPAGEADYRKALELDPNSALGHLWYARNLAQVGRLDEALQEIGAAQRQDPLAPIIRVYLAKILCTAHRYDRAIEQSRAAIDLDPDFAAAFSVLAQAHTLKGQFPEAIEAAKKYVELSSNSGWARLELAYTYAAAGNKAEADGIMRDVTAQTAEFSPYDMATICAASHDNPGALRWLEKAIEQRSVDVVWVRVDPRLDNVRSDPLFEPVVARMAPRH
jgi:adenylate cyclase